MAKLTIPRIKNIYGSLNNEKRIQIILLCSKKEFTVTELSKELKIGFVCTSQYIGQLYKVGLIQKTRQPDRTVKIKSLYSIDRETGELRKL